MRNVAVFFGGDSSENEISILTGVFILSLLRNGKYNVFPIYLHTDGGLYSSNKMFDLQTFKKKEFTQFSRVFLDGGVLYAFKKGEKIKRLSKIDVGLNCCHGGLGEGGGISALAQLNGIPFASPDVTSSSVFMDKILTKTMMQGLGVPTVDYIRVNEKDYKKRGAFLIRSIEMRLKYPVVIKPAHLGSSIGITVARTEEEAKQGLDLAFELDDGALIEKYLENKKDINCGACTLGGEIYVSEPEYAFGDGFYSFEEKYIKRQTDGIGKYGGIKSERVKGEIRSKIRAYTKTVYKKMNMQGVVRMDFLLQDDKVYLCEVNTVPGSLAYYLFCERLIDAKNFVCDLIDEALSTKQEAKKKIVTGILNKQTFKK